MRSKARVACAMALFLSLSLAPRAQAQPVCPGDCDGDGEVSVDEILLVVNMLLEGGGSPGICPGAYSNGNLSVASIVASINSVMLGCRIWVTPQPE